MTSDRDYVVGYVLLLSGWAWLTSWPWQTDLAVLVVVVGLAQLAARELP